MIDHEGWTEERAERYAELFMDRLDHDFMQGKMTQEEYDARVKWMDTFCREMMAKGKDA